MAFIEKDESKRANVITLSEEEQNILYTNTFRCPTCFRIPTFNLNLDYDTLLTVKVTCKCGIKDIEINDFLDIYSKDFRGNIQCNDCKEFATRNNTAYKYCLKCKKFFCGDCQFDHMIIKEHTFIPFKDVGAICPKHNIYNQAYCKNCKKDICKECYYIKQHDGHKIINYNSLLLSDLEMVDLNKNYGKVQLTVLFKDIEIKETVHSLLKDVDELIQNYVTELFDANKEKNQYILKFFKILLILYNNSEHKTYNLIMNVRNNIGFNTATFEIKPDSKMDSNTLLNKFYLYSKNHCIAKKPKPFKEKVEKIDFKKAIVKSEMDDVYKEMIENIDLYEKFFSIKEAQLKDKDKNIQIQSPFQYKNFIYFGEYIEKSENNIINENNENNKIIESDEKNKENGNNENNKINENNEINENKLIAHGRGLLIYKNGDKYLGNFENGKKSKLGIYYFKNGAKYKGQWENNKLNGYGIYYYANGTIYEGYFKDNKRNGSGILTTSNGDIYESQWENGNISCIGKIIYKDGKIYEGYIKNYKKDSCGTIKYPNGDAFTGIIFDDSLYFGTFTRKNGDTYLGYFKDSKMNGYGKLKNVIKNEVYEGYFNNDKKQGIGKYFYNNGDIYNGYWFDDLRNGFGILKYHNGDWYEGMFVKDIKNGIGIYYEKKGDEYYLGEWAQDNKEGVATIYNQNWTYEGTVKNGVRVGLGFLFYDENVYSGSFNDNMLDGQGTLISSKDKEIYKGIFIKGNKPSSILYDFEFINKY